MFQNSRDKQGFTLLESFLAIILSLGIFWCLDSYARGMLAMKEAEVITVAMNLAGEKIEELRRQNYDNVSSQSRELVPGFSILGDDPSVCPRQSFVREVQVNEVSNLKQVDVFVYWCLPKAGEQSFVLSTYVVDF